MNTQLTMDAIESASRNGITLEQYAGIVRSNKRSYKRKQKKAKPESALVNAMMRWLYYQSDFFDWRANSGAFKLDNGNWFRSNIKGCSDILSCMGPYGILVAIEAKIHPNKQNDDQKAFQASIEGKGGVYLLSYSLEELMAQVEALREQFRSGIFFSSRHKESANIQPENVRGA